MVVYHARCNAPDDFQCPHKKGNTCTIVDNHCAHYLKVPVNGKEQLSNLTIKLPYALKTRIAEVAAEQGRSTANWVRWVLEQAVIKKEGKQDVH